MSCRPFVRCLGLQSSRLTEALSRAFGGGGIDNLLWIPSETRSNGAPLNSFRQASLRTDTHIMTLFRRCGTQNRSSGSERVFPLEGS